MGMQLQQASLSCHRERPGNDNAVNITGSREDSDMRKRCEDRGSERTATRVSIDDDSVDCIEDDKQILATRHPPR